MNIAHKLNKLNNRLKRLKKKVADAGADRQGVMTGRIAEIGAIFKQNKML